MTVTREEYAQLQTKAACPVREGWRDGVLTVWVAGTPKHYKGKGHRYVVARHTRDWRERTATRLLVCRIVDLGPRHHPGDARYENRWPWKPEQPKRITFTVYTSGRGFDLDNLELVASPCRDALKDMRIIDDDGNKRDGTPRHSLTYLQVTRATATGISIQVGVVNG